MIAQTAESKLNEKSKSTQGKAKPSGKATKARRGGPGGPKRMEASRGARQTAAALLEVLGGTRTPTEAAEALKISLPRYYMLETRALKAMLKACEPPPRGARPDSRKQLEQLRHENRRLKDECARYTALLRAAQRTIGLAKPVEKPVKAGGKKRRKKRPTVRALKVVQRLLPPEQSEVPKAPPQEEASV